MWPIVKAYAQAILKRRWLILGLPPVCINSLQFIITRFYWPDPADTLLTAFFVPSTLGTVVSLQLGLLLAQSLAWYEEYAKYLKITTERPRFVLASPPIDTSIVRLTQVVNTPGNPQVRFSAGEITTLKLRIVNDPKVPSATASVQGVNARICFYDTDNNLISDVAGRWADSPQRTERDVSRDRIGDILNVPFPIGQMRLLDIAYKDSGGRCVIVDDENAQYSSFQAPSRPLLTGAVKVVVKLNTPYVRTKISFTFDCENWSLTKKPEVYDELRV